MHAELCGLVILAVLLLLSVHAGWQHLGQVWVK